jgi:hypothetical protein
MSYTYSSFVEALEAYTNIAASGAEANAAFVAALPTIIDQAEQRIYTDLQLLATVVRNTSGQTVSGTRNFTLPIPAGTLGFNVVQSINILNGDARTQVVKVARELMDALWPSDAGDGTIPNKWAPINNTTLLFGPAPTTNFNVEIYGTVTPAALSDSNPITYVSTQLSGLFWVAAMVAASAYMRNFGAQADDPKMAMSWEAQYAALLPTYKTEEQMRKFQSFYGAS